MTSCDSQAVMLRRLDQRQADVAARIQSIMIAAYQIEAELLHARDFPPLRRGASEIQASESAFWGCFMGQELAGVTELEPAGAGKVSIASLVVHPDFFRQGIATRLIRHVLGCHPSAGLTVSTGALNEPALRLYRKLGFQESVRWATGCGIAMVTLSRDPQSAA